MKKKIFGLVIATLLLTGCGKVAKLSNGDDAVVSFNDGNMISVNTLYEKMKDSYALSILVQLVDTYVLETTFPSYIDSAKEYAKSYVASLEQQYDSKEDFITDLQNYGIASINEYENMMYLNYMRSFAGMEYAKTQVTDIEIKNYYKNEVVGDIELSHILITPNVTDQMSDDEIAEAEKAALNKANDLLKEIQNASDKTAKFAEIAKNNSADQATKDNGGSLGRINKSSLSQSYSELVDAGYSLKDNSLYGKVIKTELGYHIIYKNASYEKDTLENLKSEIIATLAEEKFAENTSLISVNAMAYYRKQLGMNIEDDTLNSQYSNYIANLIANYSK